MIKLHQQFTDKIFSRPALSPLIATKTFQIDTRIARKSSPAQIALINKPENLLSLRGIGRFFDFISLAKQKILYR